MRVVERSGSRSESRLEVETLHGTGQQVGDPTLRRAVEFDPAQAADMIAIAIMSAGAVIVVVEILTDLISR